LQWRKIELIPILKKLTPIFLKFQMYLKKLAKFRYEEANLLLEQKKYGEATEIISDVFKILILIIPIEQTFYPTQNPLCRNNFIGRA
jgi:hypothetical protein